MKLMMGTTTRITEFCKFGVVAIFLISSNIVSSFNVSPTWRHKGRTGPSIVFRGAGNEENEAERLKKAAEKLREEIKDMERRIGEKRSPPERFPESPEPELSGESSLKNKTVLVVGANGRVGSMVCRQLLRNFPQTQVVAAVHIVAENSSTARGYGRLSYEVGAEDGVGKIGAAWSDDRLSTFEYTEEMKDYNLKNLRVVEVELLNPVECRTILQGVDSVIWCATDFNGNKPRALTSLNAAFLFRAIAAPNKGTVEVDGIRNLLSGFKEVRQSLLVKNKSSYPISFVLVSVAQDAFPDFETPNGTFLNMKFESERILQEEFPSISYTILRMGRYEDNFVEENLDVITKGIDSNLDDSSKNNLGLRRINRRDAARFAVDALINSSLFNQKVEVWTSAK